jgi:methylmalonyl-CoA/ethylmalonyl-CoA epimerase
MRTFQEGAAMQVAMVVRDMDAAMKRHWDVFKIGPWDIYMRLPRCRTL